MWGGVRTKAWRSFAGVSPVRTAVRMARAKPRRGGGSGFSASGAPPVRRVWVAQRREGRDVDDLRLGGQRAGLRLTDEAVDAGEEGGERLAGAGGRGDEEVAAGAEGGASR